MPRLLRRAVMLLGLASAATHAAEPADERAKMRAEHDRELERLNVEHVQKVAETRAEILALEARMHVVRQMVPAAFEGDAVAQRLQRLAQASDIPALEMKGVTFGERVLLRSGTATPFDRVFVDVAGQAGYHNVGFFLDKLRHLPQIIELETLEIEAAPGFDVRFAARLAFPRNVGWPAVRPTPEPAPPAPGVRQGDLDAERSALQAARYAQRDFYARALQAAREPLRRIQAEIAAMEAMRNAGSPTRFHLALGVFAAQVDVAVLAFNRAKLARGTSLIEGAAGSPSARAGLRPALEKAGFAVDSLDMASAGDCRTFSVKAVWSPAAGSDDVLASPFVPGAMPFHPHAESACRREPQPLAGRVEARGTSGDLTLRLRGVDLVDVFAAVYSLTPESFIVDADVKGRVDVDLEGATLEAAFTAMKAAGIVVGPGPVRRVSRAGATPLSVRAYTGEPVSLHFKEAVLLDVLRLFEDLSQLPVWTAPVAEGRLNVFVRDAPWDGVLDGIAASVGMVCVVKDEGLFVGPESMSRPPWASAGAVELRRAKAADTIADWGTARQVSQLVPEDLSLVGLARAGGAWKALAYGPGRLLWVLDAGVVLKGARVHAVSATGMTFEHEGGRRTEVSVAP